MAHICFVTEELAPVTQGGAGALIYNSILALRSRGHQISVLLDVNDSVFDRAQEHFETHSVALYSVSVLTQELSTFTDKSISYGEWHYWRSHRAYWALRKITEKYSIDFVEFNDFYGTAYYSMLAKACGLAFQKKRIGGMH